MKNTILTVLIAGTALISQAQTIAQSESKTVATKYDGKNELKVNLLNSILALPEISYERLLEDNMGVGLSVAFGIGDAADDLSEYKFLATPHYRLYFGKKPAAGFFIEGNAGLASIRERYYVYSYNSINGFTLSSYEDKTKFNFGLGAAVGAKFLTRNGFLGEISGGLGRFFGSNKTVDAFPRIGITLGKRF